MSQLDFWSEVLPANPSASQDSEADWMTSVATYPSSLSAWLSDYHRTGSYGKTCQAFCHQTKDGTLEPSSGRWLTSGMGSPTECWTLNTSEWPSDADVCLLSDTVETGDVPQRYFLSPKACAGILRRAERRQKTLPQPLLQALRSVAQETSE